MWRKRVKTLPGRFDYAWSGLYDRTHLRFVTRQSVQEFLGYASFEVVGEACTPSLGQSMAPILRRFFEKDVSSGDHLSLPQSKAFTAYEKFVEPTEKLLCGACPEFLGFQIVTAARYRAGHEGSPFSRAP